MYPISIFFRPRSESSMCACLSVHSLGVAFTGECVTRRSDVTYVAIDQSEVAFSRLVSFPTARLSATPYCPWPSGGGLCLYPFRFITFRRATGRSREWRADPCICPSTPPVKQVVDSRDNSEPCAIVEYRSDTPFFPLRCFSFLPPFVKSVPFTFFLYHRSPFTHSLVFWRIRAPGFLIVAKRNASS